MSKYHKGDKFIVEIKEVINSDNGTLYRSDFKTLTFDDNGLDKLKKCEQPTISEDTLEMERMKALNEGRNEVWELANKLFGYSCDTKLTNEDLKKIFGSACEMDILRNFTPQEALAKLEAYEKEQEKARQKIMVGDIVTLEDGTKGVVMDEDGVDNVVIFTENGCIEAWINKKYITKTGKHIDIQSVLEQIKE